MSSLAVHKLLADHLWPANNAILATLFRILSGNEMTGELLHWSGNVLISQFDE